MQITISIKDIINPNNTALNSRLLPLIIKYSKNKVNIHQKLQLNPQGNRYRHTKNRHINKLFSTFKHYLGSVQVKFNI